MMAFGQRLSRWFSRSTTHFHNHGLRTVEPKDLRASRLCLGLFLPLHERCGKWSVDGDKSRLYTCRSDPRQLLESDNVCDYFGVYALASIVVSNFFYAL